MERRGGGEEEQRRWVRRRAGEEEGAGWRAGEEEEEEKQASCGTSTSTSHPSGCDMSHLRRRETWRWGLWLLCLTLYRHCIELYSTVV